MEDKTFARYYRPDSLATYVGNEKVKRTLQNTLSKGKRPQVILIKGFTGSGKTTLSRIIMRLYECTGRKDDEDVCGVCESCRDYEEYIRTGNAENLPDVKEINVAETSGKGEVVDILEDRLYPPQYGKFKYFYLDEVHKATDALQSYLLKPIEEPEEYVVYILATTDPEKLLPTIKNRANLVLDIQKATERDIAKLLGTICLKEDIKFEEEAFRLIASRADFIIRESLNYLQQVVNSHGVCTADAVSEEFDMVTDQVIYEFFNAYIQRDYGRYLMVLHRVKTRMSLKSFLLSLQNFVIRGIYIANGVKIEGLHPKEIHDYSTLFNKFDIVQLSLLLSRLLTLDTGNLEANLLNFMYRQNLEDDLVEKYSIDSSVEVEFSPTEEVKTRNLAKETSRKEAEQRGIEALSASVESVSLLENLGNFQVQKVKGEL